jgi:YVTN family beta-propeller protein
MLPSYIDRLNTFEINFIRLNHLLNVYNLRYKIGSVVFRRYSLLSITALVIIVLSSLISIDYGFIKTASAHSVTIPVRGIAPWGIAYNPVNNNMYVANTESSTVSVISGSSNSVISSILVGRFPVSIAYVPPSNKLYVTNAESNDVTVINGATNKVIRSIPVGGLPIGIAYNPSNNDAYVVNNRNNTVSIIDTSIDTVIETIPLDSVLPPPSIFEPLFVAYDSINGGMYVSGRPQVSVINSATNADVKDVRMPPPVADSAAWGLVHNTINNRIYVTAFDSDMVVRLNPETNEFEGSAIPVGSQPASMVRNPSNNNLYVTNSGSSSVSVINPTTNVVTGTISTGSTPAGIAYNSNNNHIYVTNYDSNTVSIIHP